MMRKQFSAKVLVASGLGALGAGVAAIGLGAWNIVLSSGIVPTNLYRATYLVSSLSADARGELLTCLMTGTALGSLVVLVGLAQRWASALPETEGAENRSAWSLLKQGVPLSLLAFVASLLVFGGMRLGNYHFGMPGWLDTFYGLVGTAMFAPFALLLFRARTGKLSGENLQKAALLAICAAPAWWAGHSLAPLAFRSASETIYEQFYPETHSARDEHRHQEVIVTAHPQMPPIAVDAPYLRGEDALDLYYQNELFKWQPRVVIERVVSATPSRISDILGLVYACATDAPNPTIQNALKDICNDARFHLSPGFHASFLAQACRRNGLEELATSLESRFPSNKFDTHREAHPSARVSGSLLINGNKDVRIRLVRLRDNDASSTYSELRSGMNYLQNRCGYTTGYMAREFYAVTTPDANGRFSFENIDSGRYLLQIRLDGSPVVESYTEVPVLNVESGSSSDLGNIQVTLRP